jgi:hypothetical protein
MVPDRDEYGARGINRRLKVLLDVYLGAECEKYTYR